MIKKVTLLHEMTIMVANDYRNSKDGRNDF